ncbi:MAG: hypothetical protein KDA20_04710 [Phycisphaerales bacterium]|nr:hypothetical protein [Phycisphaerales bacterium]
MLWITDLHPVILGALQLIVLSVPACALAWLMRRGGIPGGAPAAAIVGGIVAGLLIGATVAGRVAPELHDRLFIGGVDETIALADLHSEHARQRMALQATGVSPEATPELQAQQLQEAEQAQAMITTARANHAAHLRWAGLAVLALLGATVIGGCSRRRLTLSLARAPSMLLGMTLACTATLLTARLIGVPWRDAVVLGIATSAPGIARHLMAPRTAVLPLRAIWSLWLPTAVALLASVIDLPELVNHARFWWLIALGIVASSDLRWVCYWAAIRGTVRQWWGKYPWSIASRWMRDGAAPVQIMLTFLAFGLDRNLGDIIAASLVGVATIELTRNVRCRIATLLDRDPATSIGDDAVS